MFQKGLRLLYRSMGGLLRLCVITAIMMGIGWGLEKLLTVGTFSYLTGIQRDAFAAVESINPLQIKDRFFCALGPSVEAMNRKYPSVLYHPPVSTDCMYSLSLLPPATLRRSESDRSVSSGMPLPPPVVSHWAENTSPPASLFLALFDTAWHLVIQPSVFASLFAMFALALGGIVAGTLMSLPGFTWHPFVGSMVFCIGTVAAACLAAWGMQMLMEGGLYLFGGITQIAGVCCGGAGVTFFGFTFFKKTLEVGIDERIDHLVPR
jgi:hypothetical protein